MWKYILLVFTLLSFTKTFSQKAKLLFPLDSLSSYSPYFLSSDTVWVTQMVEGKENIVEYTKQKSGWKQSRLINGNMSIGGVIDSVLYYYNSRMDLYPSNDDYPCFKMQEDELYMTGSDDIIVVSADYNNNGIQPYMVVRDKGKWSRAKPIHELLSPNETYYSLFWKDDTLFFSKKEAGEKYQIYFSVYDRIEEKFGEPNRMPYPYNDDISNNVFYSKQYGMELFCSDRDGQMNIFVTNKKVIKDEDTMQMFQRVPYVNKMVLDTTIKKDYDELRYMISLRNGDRYNVSISAKGYGYYNTTVSLKIHGAKKEEVLEFFDQISGMIDQSKIYAQLGVFKTDKFAHFRSLLPKYSQDISREVSVAVKGAYKYKINAGSIEDVVEICDYTIAQFIEKKINDEPFIYVGVLGGGFRIYRKTGDLYDIVYESLPGK